VPTPLEELLEPGFELSLYRAAVQNLKDLSNPLRLNNYAYAARELSRHILHRLAPDSEVKSCSWYKEDPSQPGVIARTQRAQYAIQGGLSEQYVRDELGVDIDTTKKALADAIRNLNKFTHIEEGVFNLPPATVDAHVAATEAALDELCRTIVEVRAELLDKLGEKIDSAVVDRSLSETIIEVDELATHHTIEEVHTDDVDVVQITSERIVMLANGTLSVELQWGSNSDIRRGDGAIIPISFPFTCNLSAPVDSPEQIDSDDDTIRVDTSSWRDARDDEGMEEDL
jgi:hypothetical protein